MYQGPTFHRELLEPSELARKQGPRRSPIGCLMSAIVGCPIAIALSAWLLTLPDEWGHTESDATSQVLPGLALAALLAVAVVAWRVADLRTPIAVSVPLALSWMANAMIIGLWWPPASGIVLLSPVMLLGLICMIVVVLRRLGDRRADAAVAAALLAAEATYGYLANQPLLAVGSGLMVTLVLTVVTRGLPESPTPAPVGIQGGSPTAMAEAMQEQRAETTGRPTPDAAGLSASTVILTCGLIDAIVFFAGWSLTLQPQPSGDIPDLRGILTCLFSVIVGLVLFGLWLVFGRPRSD